MTLLPVKGMAENRGIKLRGTDEPFDKEREDHINELAIIFWAEIGKKRAERLGIPELRYIEGETNVLGKLLRRKK